MPTRVLCYQGVVQETKQWGEIDTYGGKTASFDASSISFHISTIAGFAERHLRTRLIISVSDKPIRSPPIRLSAPNEPSFYEATGAKMFNVPISTITKGSVLRDKSKISELALGIHSPFFICKPRYNTRLNS